MPGAASARPPSVTGALNRLQALDERIPEVSGLGVALVNGLAAGPEIPDRLRRWQTELQAASKLVGARLAAKEAAKEAAHWDHHRLEEAVRVGGSNASSAPLHSSGSVRASSSRPASGEGTSILASQARPGHGSTTRALSGSHSLLSRGDANQLARMRGRVLATVAGHGTRQGKSDGRAHA